MQETQIRPLSWEDTLKKKMATHSRIPAWEIPWTEETGWATVHGVTKNLTGLTAKQHAFLPQTLIPNKLPAHQSLSEESASQGTQSVTISLIYEKC